MPSWRNTRIGFASQPQINSRPTGRFSTSANLGVPEITVPAGFNDVVYEPRFTLNDARNAYVTVANDDTPATLALPMPVGISFWGGPGDEGVILKVAAVYESATRHRQEPKAFGPVSRTPPTHF